MILIPGNAKAQSNSDGVTLNIRFLPVQTIEVRPVQKNAELIYATIEDYENGVSVTFDDHLTVTSTGGFQVNVVANDAYFSSTKSSGRIPVSEIVVIATNGSDNTEPYVYNNVSLSTKPEFLINSKLGGRDLKYNVTYDNTSSASKYIENFAVNGSKETIYKAEITYTITSK